MNNFKLQYLKSGDWIDSRLTIQSDNTKTAITLYKRFYKKIWRGTWQRKKHYRLVHIPTNSAIWGWSDFHWYDCETMSKRVS